MTTNKHSVQQYIRLTAALGAALGSGLHIAEIHSPSAPERESLPSLTVHAHSAQEVERAGTIAEQFGFRTILSRADQDGIWELKLVGTGGSGGSGPSIPGLETCPGLIAPRPRLSLMMFDEMKQSISRRVDRWWRV